MAERGEAGVGRMAEPLEIVAAAEALLARRRELLAGKRVLVTSGPTSEPIDPVRFIANRSSGKQGHAIAAAAAAAGAEVTLVSGPVTLPDPPGVSVVQVETAREMLAAVETALPADVAVFAAAVADWRAAAGERRARSRKAAAGRRRSRSWRIPTSSPPIAHRKSGRPTLVIGFAAETEDVDRPRPGEAQAKKGCDWILANDVSPATGIMGGDDNTVHLVTRGRRRSVAAAIERDVSRACWSRGSPPTLQEHEAVTPSRCASSRLPHGADLPLPQYQSAQRRRPRSPRRGAGRCAGRARARRARA